MNELAVIPFGDASRTHLELPPTLSEKQWKDVGHSLLRCDDSLRFWIGDWLNFGREKFKDAYEQAIFVFESEASTSYGFSDRKALAGMATVARRVPKEQRREDLSFKHHAVVSSLNDDQQDFWLSKAQENKLNAHAMTMEIRGGQKQDFGKVKQAPTPFYFEAWINEGERGIKHFPPTKWADDVLKSRHAKLLGMCCQLEIEMERRTKGEEWKAVLQ